jgi:hypothetical protein
MTKVLGAMLLFVAMASGIAASQEQTVAKSPVFTYWHNRTDNDGVSHMSKTESDHRLPLGQGALLRLYSGPLDC